MGDAVEMGFKISDGMLSSYGGRKKKITNVPFLRLCIIYRN